MSDVGKMSAETSPTAFFSDFFNLGGPWVPFFVPTFSPEIFVAHYQELIALSPLLNLSLQIPLELPHLCYNRLCIHQSLVIWLCN